MGGFFGVVSNKDCVMDLFFGTDYHSHLGTKRGGMAVYGQNGFKRSIHNIENSPFRSKFEADLDEMEGKMGIGCISDTDPQPLIVRSLHGRYALTTVGRINNKQQLVDEILEGSHTQFMEQSGGEVNNTELVAALIAKGEDLVSGIKRALELVDGSLTLLLLTPDGLYAARDKYGRTPVILGKKKDGYCASFESFAFLNLGYKFMRELGPGEIVKITELGVETLVKPGDKMRICSFLWTYYGYTTSTYEGVNVEEMRYRCGALLAKNDREDNIEVDCVAGVPDSGTAHAIGYANEAGVPFSRPLIKYTPTWPRSFMPQNQKARRLIAKMKLVPVDALIRDKRLLIIDDSIVRGTQLSETVDYLHASGAKEVHVRPACPPIMFACKYLNFSRSTSEYDLITRRVIKELEGRDPDEATLMEYADSSTEKHKKMVDKICEELHFTTLKYHELEEMSEAIGIPSEKLCTYCWNGVE